MSTQKKYEVTGVAGVLKPYICGGSAHVCLQLHSLIDLTKVRLQLIGAGSSGGVRPSAISVMGNIVKTEGATGLYRGLSASLTRQATYGTARIGLYQAFSDEVSRRRGGGPLPLYLKFATSFSSGAIASSIGNPFDVSLVRMQADAMAPAAERRNYKGVVDAVTRIIKEEGFGDI